MKTYTINGTDIVLEDVMYYEFFIGDNDEPQFLTMKWDKILSQLESGKMNWESNKPNIMMLSRWVNEAPRKRRYRDLMREGHPVASTEYFFEADGGDEFIDGLERTGKLAAEVLRAYGEEPVGPIVQDDPSRPATIDEVLGKKNGRGK